jgi:hypothetical protein
MAMPAPPDGGFRLGLVVGSIAEGRPKARRRFAGSTARCGHPVQS